MNRVQSILSSKWLHSCLRNKRQSQDVGAPFSSSMRERCFLDLSSSEAPCLGLYAPIIVFALAITLRRLRSAESTLLKRGIDLNCRQDFAIFKTLSATPQLNGNFEKRRGDRGDTRTLKDCQFSEARLLL